MIVGHAAVLKPALLRFARKVHQLAGVAHGDDVCLLPPAPAPAYRRGIRRHYDQLGKLVDAVFLVLTPDFPQQRFNLGASRELPSAKLTSYLQREHQVDEPKGVRAGSESQPAHSSSVGQSNT
jgi:hypothetical protein